MDDPVTTANDGAEAFGNLERRARQAGASIALALAAGQTEGRKLEDVLQNVGSRLAQVAVQSAGRGLAGSLASTLSSTLVSGISSLGSSGFSLAAPAALSGLSDVAGNFAAASSVSSEAAPAARPVSIAMTINTPDAESFRRSEAQVSATLARAVQRGQRGL